MRQIIKSQIYDIPAREVVEILCSECNELFIRKIGSIRLNIKKNGDYICHKCIITSKKYIAKQRISHPKTGRKWDKKVIVQCFRCGVEYNIIYRSMQWAKKHNKPHHCAKCAHQLAHENGNYKAIYTDEFIKKLHENGKRFWDTVVEGEWKSQYMAHLLNDVEYIQLMSECGKKPWKDVRFKNLMQSDKVKLKRFESLKVILNDEKYIQKLSENTKKNWENQKYREIITEKTRKRMNTVKWRTLASLNGKKPWQDPEYRKKMAIVRATQPRISSLQVMLYSFLDDLNVKFYEESERTAIGYYAFDCMIPLPNNRKLLVECQGDYWHSLDGMVARDKSKFTYINRYFPECEIMYIWEHEFYVKDRVLDRLKLKLDIDIKTACFEFSDIIVTNDLEAGDIRSFLDSYHYIGRGRGGITVGATHNGKLIAAAVFSPPLRQNQNNFHGNFRELSRFCIHPSYHKKNFATWLLSRFMKHITDVSKIIAFSDTTVGHDGGIYRAANFKFSHEVKPDYWYVDIDGYVMHKRTLYGRAKKMKLTEAEFATTYKYYKKYGGPKKCFVIEI